MQMQSAGTKSVRTCTPLLSQAGRVGFGNGAQQPWESCRALRGAQPGGGTLGLPWTGEDRSTEQHLNESCPSPEGALGSRGGFGAAALVREKERGAKARLIKVCHAGLWAVCCSPSPNDPATAPPGACPPAPRPGCSSPSWGSS